MRPPVLRHPIFPEPTVLASAKLAPVIAAAGAVTVTEAALTAAAVDLAVQLLRDPAVRAKILDATETHIDAMKTAVALGKKVASGSIKIAPRLLDALRSYTKKGACSCGEKHDHAAKIIRSAKSQTVASGVLRADAAAMWKLLTGSFYAGGDLPVLCVREALQNSLDALSERWHATPSGFTPFFAVSLDGSTLTIEDNGIGMAPPGFTPTAAVPLSTRLDKFMTLGGSEKVGESFGGFGAAKAVILGAGEKGWTVETGWVILRSPSSSPGQIYDVERAPAYRQGTKITLYGIRLDSRSTPYTSGNYASTAARIRAMLSLNKVPGVELRFAGPDSVESEITYLYEGRRSASVPDWADLLWGGTDDQGRRVATGAIRMFQRDEGYARLILRLRRMTEWGEAFLIQTAEMLWVQLPRDIFLDLTIRVKPDAPGYPLRVSRDGFVDPIALDSYNRIKSDINSEEDRRKALARIEKEKDEWEILFPDASDPEERRGGEQVDAAIAEALDGLQGMLDDVLKDIHNYHEDSMGMSEEGRQEMEGQPSAASAPNVFGDIQALIEASAEPGDLARAVQGLAGVAGITLSGDAQIALSVLTSGDALDAETTALIIDEVGRMDRVLVAVAGEGGGMLSGEAGAVAAVVQALVQASSEPEAPVVRKARESINPFGNRAFVRISRLIPKEVAKKFKKNLGKYVPLLALWSATLKIVVHATRSTPSYLPGFLVEQDVRGEAILAKDGQGKVRHFVCINPIMWDEYAALYPNRPDLLAHYLLILACHEIAHLPYLKNMDQHDGHDEDWARARESLAFSTATALPLIESMVEKLLKMKGGKGKKGAKGSAELKQIRSELDKAQGETARLGQEVRYYRDWFGNADAAVHNLLRRLDQYERVQGFGSWLERLPIQRRPSGISGEVWGQIVGRLVTNPVLSLDLLESAVRGPG